ncbi:MAG: hypothetical protein SFX19_01645 [Alphaproteobacteria bacterium]|nr:hypothetical protein [Alphaproteobacteria bacterium]
MVDEVREYSTIAEPSELVIPRGGDVPYHMRFTRDPQLISRFWKLRDKLYRSDPRFEGFRFFSYDEAENYLDPDDQMLIIHDEHRCYGGACLRISTPRKPIMLDMEKDISTGTGQWYFSLQEQLPDMQLDKYAYAEFNRIVVEPALRTGSLTKKIFEAIRDRCLEYRVRYIFGSSDLVRARYYKRLYMQLGLAGGVLENIDIPMHKDYEGHKMYLFYGDTKPFYTVDADPEAKRLLQPADSFEFY